MLLWLGCLRSTTVCLAAPLSLMACEDVLQDENPSFDVFLRQPNYPQDRNMRSSCWKMGQVSKFLGHQGWTKASKTLRSRWNQVSFQRFSRPNRGNICCCESKCSRDWIRCQWCSGRDTGHSSAADLYRIVCWHRQLRHGEQRGKPKRRDAMFGW